MVRSVLGGAMGFALVLGSREASAATLQVGPGKPYAELAELQKTAKPGDVIEVFGDHTYKTVFFEAKGTKAAPIVIRGVRVNGKRPVVAGGENTVLLMGDNTVFEGFEVTGGSETCVVHKADNVTLRDLVVHDCPKHGILGTDSDSGSLLMEYVEVYATGSGQQKHQVYIATDEAVHPGSVFRMQHCYVHDGNGGDSVKSRAERNEIYSNWLEGADFFELELLGPDDDSNDTVTAPREDGDVVGNVFFQHKGADYVVRIGGDGTGRTGGRYRFLNNTFVHGGGPGNKGSIRFSYALDSVELYGNVFFSPTKPIEYLFRETELTWVTSRQIVGSNNWISQGAMNVPTTLKDSIFGTDPGFVDLAKRDVRLTAASPLVDKGTASTARTDAFAFPRPLAKASFTPPLRVLASVGKASARAEVGVVDIGAFEFGSPTEEPGKPGTEPPPVPGTPALPAPGNGEGGTTEPGASPSSGEEANDGCACSEAPRRGSRWGAVASIVGLLTAWAIRRKR
jgi:hypothetical protein